MSSCIDFASFIFLLPANDVWGKVMFSQVFVCPQGEWGSLSQHSSQVTWPAGLCPGGPCLVGVSVQGTSVKGGSLFRGPLSGGSLSMGVFVQWGGLCPGRGSLSRDGIFVHRGGLCPGREISVQGVSVQGGLCPGQSLSREGGLCPGRGSLSRKGVFVQEGGLCPGRGSLSREGVSVQEGGLCPGRGSLSREGGLCPGRGVFVQGGGSLSREGGLCTGRGSLSRGALSGRPPNKDPLYNNERAVRILLECILVCLVRSVLLNLSAATQRHLLKQKEMPVNSHIEYS